MRGTVLFSLEKWNDVATGPTTSHLYSTNHHPRHFHLAPAVASGMSHDLCGGTVMAEDLLLMSFFAFYRIGPNFPGSV